MGNGYMGKVLFVDLSSGEIREETIPDDIYLRFASGVGLASRLLYHRIPAGADPLGPDNILGFVSGLLTGTGALFTGRWMAVGKSPLTGGWGDANAGGKLSPALKRSGYDGIFFSGISPKPVYLKVINGKAELVDASHLWGLDIVEADERIKQEIDQKVQLAVIGPAGEKCSFIAGIANDKARIAARSGLGAVMGSKKLKALAVGGKQKIQVADPAKVKDLNAKFMKWFNKGQGMSKYIGANLLNIAGRFIRVSPVAMGMTGDMAKIAVGKYGTIVTNVLSSENGDAPVKNWKGVGYRDFSIPTHANNLNPQRIIDYQVKKYHCDSCPMGCGGILEIKDGPYPLGETHKPEYEACTALGALLLNNDLPTIFKLNDMLNRAGMDCISAGATVAWAMECYEHGILSREELDGIDLTWGNAESIIRMIDKMIRRDGVGDLLADGSRRAVEKLGRGAEYAMHAGGQELPMHDSRFDPGFAVSYVLEPTPGRHTNHGYQWLDLFELNRIFKKLPKLSLVSSVKKKYKPDEGKNRHLVAASQYMQFVNGVGACLFGVQMGGNLNLPAYVNAVTGWNKPPEYYLEVGERIQNMRQAFNVRHGIRPRKDFALPDRAGGRPPLAEGPLKGVTLDVGRLHDDFLRGMGWDPETGGPTREKLRSLDLADVGE